MQASNNAKHHIIVSNACNSLLIAKEGPYVIDAYYNLVFSNGVTQENFPQRLNSSSQTDKKFINKYEQSGSIHRENGLTWEYKKVPKIAIAAPRALTGWTGVWNMMMDDTMTDIRFMVFPMLNVKGDISSNDMYDTWL